MCLWIENIGSISFVDSKQCVWKAPSALVLDSGGSAISPFFFLEGRRWRIAKVFDKLYLWNEEQVLPYDVRTVTLSVKGEEDEDAWSCEGETYLDYGFGGELLASSYVFVSRIRANGNHGYIKIFCKVEKSENNPSDKYPLSSEATNKVDNTSNSEEEEQPKEIKVKGVERLVQNLKSLLANGQRSDVTLKVVDREFLAHMVILEARCPVLASLIQLERKDETSNVVDIPDCTTEAIEVLLLYLYTGSAESMSSENVFNVYYAAGKFRVDDLKEDCVHFMKDNMSVENIVDILVLLLRHTETGLLKDATDFFRQNIQKVVVTAKWQRYMEKNGKHANELLIKALGA